MQGCVRPHSTYFPSHLPTDPEIEVESPVAEMRRRKWTLQYGLLSGGTKPPQLAPESILLHSTQRKHLGCHTWPSIFIFSATYAFLPHPVQISSSPPPNLGLPDGEEVEGVELSRGVQVVVDPENAVAPPWAWTSFMW